AGNERYHLAAFARPETHRLHAVAEWRIDRWVRILQRSRHDADFLELLVGGHGLGAENVGGGESPLGPVPDLPQITLDAGRRLRPQLLQDTPIFVEHGAVALVGF